MVIGTMTNLNLKVFHKLMLKDDKIKSIWKQQHPLKPFLDPSNFKTYDELKEKLNRTITGVRSTTTADKVDLPPQSTVV
jgi:SPX domain protein involved in polyphosphate accumulation